MTDEIFETRATIYSKDNCPFCVKAKMLLKKHNISYSEISAIDNKQELVDLVTKETGQPPKTVPQIWLDGEYIGGYDNLAKKLV